MSARCEGIVAALAGGGPIGRWRALRHAARCPRCAAARDELRQIADALAAVAPLTAPQRRLWTLAAVGDAEAEAAPARAGWLRPALAAAVLAAAVLGGLLRPPGPRPRPPEVARHDPPAVADERLRDVENLRGGVAALARELDELRHRVDLLDARKEVDALMARLPPKDGAGGL